MSELQLIAEIKRRCEKITAADFSLTIGDDCAIRNPMENSRKLLLSADISIEDVHFSRLYMSLYEIGYKSVITNISDIAAMGGIPDFLMVSLAFPRTLITSEILELYDGIVAAGLEYKIPVVGGDLSKSDKITISITIGGLSQKRILRRSGAKLGDNIWVSGNIGSSGRGLSLLQKYGRKIAEEKNKKAVLAHIRPKAQINLGNYLQNNYLVSSCIDVSDGVAKEISAICAESKVGAIIFENERFDEYFFSGGEDYELLFTADNNFVPDFEELKLTKIGEIIAEQGVFVMQNGEKKALSLTGFSHF